MRYNTLHLGRGYPLIGLSSQVYWVSFLFHLFLGSTTFGPGPLLYLQPLHSSRVLTWFKSHLVLEIALFWGPIAQCYLTQSCVGIVNEQTWVQIPCWVMHYRFLSVHWISFTQNIDWYPYPPIAGDKHIDPPVWYGCIITKIVIETSRNIEFDVPVCSSTTEGCFDTYRVINIQFTFLPSVNIWSS